VPITSAITMADVGGYRYPLTRYPVMKDCFYGTCAADCDQFLAGTCSSYRQSNGTRNYDMRPTCEYPVVVGNGRDGSYMALPEIVYEALSDTESCSDVYRMSANFRSDCSPLMRQTSASASTAAKIYPWMKETRQNRKRQLMATLPGQLTSIC